MKLRRFVVFVASIHIAEGDNALPAETPIQNGLNDAFISSKNRGGFSITINKFQVTFCDFSNRSGFYDKTSQNFIKYLILKVNRYRSIVFLIVYLSAALEC